MHPLRTYTMSTSHRNPQLFKRVIVFTLYSSCKQKVIFFLTFCRIHNSLRQTIKQAFGFVKEKQNISLFYFVAWRGIFLVIQLSPKKFQGLLFVDVRFPLASEIRQSVSGIRYAMSGILLKTKM